MADNSESSPNLEIAELSLRDELGSSLQRAFGVALEIVFSEVTKLVSHALHGARLELREALRANRDLESRLEAAKRELREAAKRERQTLVIPVNLRVISTGREPIGPLSEAHPSSEHRARAQNFQDSRVSHQVIRTDAFGERQQDGISCDQDINPNVTEELITAHHLFEARDLKRDLRDVQENVTHAHQACFRASVNPEAPAVQDDSQEVEQAYSQTDPRPDGEFGSEAQAGFLENWGLDPVQLQNRRRSDSYTTSGSTVFNISHLDLSALASSTQPYVPPCHSDVAFLPEHMLHQVNPTQRHSPGYASDVAARRFEGQSVTSMLQELRWYHQPRVPGRGLSPPGQSYHRCLLCGRDFHRLEHLKTHQRIHSNEKPYLCTACGTRFRHSWALTRHSRIHTGEKPYLCAQCGKGFRNCGGLRFHEKTHARDEMA